MKIPFDTKKKNKRRLNVLDKNNNILWVVVIHIYKYKYAVKCFFFLFKGGHDVKLLKASHII